jgi:uncharacterized membrane protein
VIYCLDGLDTLGTGFVVKPNQAISWQSLVLVYTGIAAVTFTIGVSFYLIGMTLILPFSGIEILALGAAFYLTAWRGGIQEVILINRDTIVIELGRQHPVTRETFQRAWARVVLERSWNSWYPSRLLIRSHGRQVEIGKFLNEQERQGLAMELSKALKNNQALN